MNWAVPFHLIYRIFALWNRNLILKALPFLVILIIQGINKIRDKPPHGGASPLKLLSCLLLLGARAQSFSLLLGGRQKNGHKPVKKLSEWGHYSFPQCQIGLLSGILWRNPEAVSRCPEFVLWIRWHPPISMKTLWAAHWQLNREKEGKKYESNCIRHPISGLCQ